MQRFPLFPKSQHIHNKLIWFWRTSNSFLLPRGQRSGSAEPPPSWCFSVLLKDTCGGGCSRSWGLSQLSPVRHHPAADKSNAPIWRSCNEKLEILQKYYTCCVLHRNEETSLLKIFKASRSIRPQSPHTHMHKNTNEPTHTYCTQINE